MENDELIQLLGEKLRITARYREVPQHGQDGSCVWIEDKSAITEVHIGFTPEEWTRIATRDGDEYIGGCCGTTARMQDIICLVHRESGYISANAFNELASVAILHEGHEVFRAEMTRELFDKYTADTDTLSLWNRIGLAFAVCAPKMSESRKTSPVTGLTARNNQNIIHEVMGGLRLLRWQDVTSRGSEDSFQHSAAQKILISRIIPSIRVLIDALREKAGDAIEAVCVVHPDDRDVVMNSGYGLAVFKDAQQAEANFARIKNDVKFAIRPCRISFERGLEFTDIAQAPQGGV